jgi:Flp pilus assembly protein TadD
MNNFAMALNYQGRYIEAEPLFRQTLTLRKAISSEEHPNTLTCMNNLALVLKNQRKYDEAESIYRQTLT